MSSKGQPAKGQGAKCQGAKGQAAKGHGAKGQGAKCQPSKCEPPAKCQPAKDQPPKIPSEIEKGITDFDAGSLKHTEVQEKQVLPTSEGIESVFDKFGG